MTTPPPWVNLCSAIAGLVFAILLLTGGAPTFGTMFFVVAALNGFAFLQPRKKPTEQKELPTVVDPAIAEGVQAGLDWLREVAEDDKRLYGFTVPVEWRGHVIGAEVPPKVNALSTVPQSDPDFPTVFDRPTAPRPRKKKMDNDLDIDLPYLYSRKGKWHVLDGRVYVEMGKVNVNWYKSDTVEMKISNCYMAGMSLEDIGWLFSRSTTVVKGILIERNLWVDAVVEYRPRGSGASPVVEVSHPMIINHPATMTEQELRALQAAWRSHNHSAVILPEATTVTSMAPLPLPAQSHHTHAQVAKMIQDRLDQNQELQNQNRELRELIKGTEEQIRQMAGLGHEEISTGPTIDELKTRRDEAMVYAENNIALMKERVEAAFQIKPKKSAKKKAGTTFPGPK